MRRNDKRSSYTVNLHNKGRQSSEFKNHWLRFHRVFFSPPSKLASPAIRHSWYIKCSAGSLGWGCPKISCVDGGCAQMSSVHSTAALQHQGLAAPLEPGASHAAPLEETSHTRTALPRHRVMKVRQMPLLAVGGNC